MALSTPLPVPQQPVQLSHNHLLCRHSYLIKTSISLDSSYSRQDNELPIPCSHASSLCLQKFHTAFQSHILPWGEIPYLTRYTLISH